MPGPTLLTALTLNLWELLGERSERVAEEIPGLSSRKVAVTGAEGSNVVQMLGSIEADDWTSKEVIEGWGENFLRSEGAALTTTEIVVSDAIDRCGVIGLDGARILGVTTRVDGVPGSE